MCSELCDDTITRATCGSFPEFRQFVVRLYEPRKTNLQHPNMTSVMDNLCMKCITLHNG